MGVQIPLPVSCGCIAQRKSIRLLTDWSVVQHHLHLACLVKMVNTADLKFAPLYGYRFKSDSE
jgi:hypothetical protein